MSVDSVNNLISLDDLHKYLELETSDGYDTKLENLIDAVSWFFNTYTNRELKSRAQTELIDGDNTDTIFIKHYPITAITSIHVSTDTPRSYGSAELISSDDYVRYEDEGKVCLLDSYFDKGYQTVKIIYTGGYTTIPHELQLAAKEMCVMAWTKQKEKVIGMSSMTIAGVSTTLNFDAIMPEYVRAVLEKYMRYS
jgi:hypothetical protein